MEYTKDFIKASKGKLTSTDLDLVGEILKGNRVWLEDDGYQGRLVVDIKEALTEMVTYYDEYHNVLEDVENIMEGFEKDEKEYRDYIEYLEGQLEENKVSYRKLYLK